MTRFPVPRAASAALVAAFVLLPAPLLADEVQEASRLLKAGQHQQALERVNKALAAKPKDPQARFLKGLIYAEQGNPKEASEIFLRLTQDYPDLPEPYNNLAVLYAAQGQYDKARAALEQSIRTHPSYATAYENLGDVYAKLASQAYDKALQIDSGNAAAKNKLALVRDLVGGAPAANVQVAAAPKEKPALKPPVEPTKAPVAAATPAPEPKPAVEKPAVKKPADAELIEAVNAWAKAWSSKNVDAYLAAYARDFRPPKGESREDWAKGRRQRISAPKNIAVSIDSPKVAIAADGSATITFRQGYRSDIVKSTSTKTLVMVKSDGRWLIQQEKVN
jgi:tetratricopeptide (TPR) repeat protein